MVGRALPGVPGEECWCRAVFSLARALQCLGYTDAADPALDDLVDAWHGRLTECQCSLAELWKELAGCLERVRNPAGQTFAEIWAQPDARPLPRAARRFRGDQSYEALIRGCRNLAGYYRGQPFPLSCRQAGKVLGVSYTTANAMLRSLVAVGVLREVEKGSKRPLAPGSGKGTASTWLFVAEEAGNG